MNVANKKSHTLPHLHVVNNAHPFTFTPYAKFQPDWFIIKFLAGIMRCHMGVAMTIPHPLTHVHMISNATQLLRNIIPNFSLVGPFTSL